MVNKKRLIDANALQLEPDHWGGMNGVLMVGRSGGKTMALVQAALKRMIDNAPTVDAVEVVHGEWACVNESENVWMCTGKDGCGNEILLLEGTPKDNGWNYCPNCGAKMDGGNEDG